MQVNIKEALLNSINTEEFSDICAKIVKKTTGSESYLTKDDSGWSLFNSSESFFQDCVEILTDREAGRIAQEIFKLIKLRDEHEAKIAKLRDARYTAPVKSWNPFASTKSSIDKEIQELQKDISDMEKRMDELRTKLLIELTSHGIELDKDTLNFMLASAISEDITNSLIVTDTFKQILFSIEYEMEKSQDHASAQQYTSMYLVCLLSFRHTQSVTLKDIDLSCNKIDKIIDEARANIEDAKKIKGWSQDPTLQSNIQINNSTINVAMQYRSILKTYQMQIHKEAYDLDRNISIARNVYRTVTTAGTLVNVIRQNDESLKKLFSFKYPSLNGLYSIIMTKEFNDISSRLKNM